MTQNKFETLGKELGELVSSKNKAYGNSFGKAGEFLKLLYPNGIEPEQYTDILLLVRMWDKLMRVATHKDYNDESPYMDIGGYAILGVLNDRETALEHQEPSFEN